MKKKVEYMVKGILFILIIVLFIIIGNKDFSKDKPKDNERFDSEYKTVDKNNAFYYTTASEVYSKFRNGNAVIFMGFPENTWSGYYAKMLNEAAKSVGLKEILYYNFLEDRNNKNATYQSIVLRLNDYVPTLDNSNKDIYSPTLLIIKDGQVIYFDNDTAINSGSITPEEYWNETQKRLKINELKEKLTNYLE